MRSPIKGGDGNEEYLIYFIKSSSTVGDVEWREKIKTLTIKSEKEVRKQP
jgi:hypothetical protein